LHERFEQIDMQSAATLAVDAMEAVCVSERALVEEKLKAAHKNTSDLVDQEHRTRLRDRARELAARRHAPNNAAREFVESEWGKHRTHYDNNKTEFARHYVVVLRQKFVNGAGDPMDIKEKTIRDVWLSDTPRAGTRGLLPAHGE
jgi:hypothetical protein